MAKIDNDKMWESLYRYGHKYEHFEDAIPEALRDQGLKYDSDTKKIESIKPETLRFEKGKWYVKTCHTYDGYLRHFKEGCVYQAIDEVTITDGYHHASLNSWQVHRYFRLATPEEIPQEDYHWNGKIEKKEATGVLKEMLDNIDEEELAKTREEMLKESSDGELTEFEIRIYDWCSSDSDGQIDRNTMRKISKNRAKILMDLARKQIASEINIDERVQKFKDGVKENPYGILACLTLHGAYKLGMDDTLKAIKGE